MAAFLNLAWALAPKLLYNLAHRDDPRSSPATPRPELTVAAARRHRDLACHWDRAADGTLMAHWVHESDDAIGSSTARCGRSLQRRASLVAVADVRFDTQSGSTLTLAALSRMARLNASIERLERADAEAGPPE